MSQQTVLNSIRDLLYLVCFDILIQFHSGVNILIRIFDLSLSVPGFGSVFVVYCITV